MQIILKRPLNCLSAALTALSLLALPVHASDFPMADKVIVEKQNRKLHLMNSGKVFRTFEIALGVAPVGDKEREGDQKTPEGLYLLDGRNPDSDFWNELVANTELKTITNFLLKKKILERNILDMHRF